MGIVGQLAEIRDLAGVPQQPQPPPALRQLPDIGIAGQRRQRFQVRGLIAAHQSRHAAAARSGCRAGRPSRRNQGRCCASTACSSASKVWASTAATTSSGIGGHSVVVPNVPSFMPRPARPAIWPTSEAVRRRGPMAVELAQPGESDVVDIHVQAHADGVGRDQEIDLPLLV